MSNRVFIVGNGMTKFLKPRPANPDYPLMAKQATLRALRDAGITYDQIQHVNFLFNIFSMTNIKGCYWICLW